MTAPAVRILTTGSRAWANVQRAEDVMNASISLLQARHAGSVLVHAATPGAGSQVTDFTRRMGMVAEPHPVGNAPHASSCPDWDRVNASCHGAVQGRYQEMVQLGADLCIVLPSHGYALTPGSPLAGTSRGTWGCAERARDAGIPTVVAWGQSLFPFGQPGADLLASTAIRKRLAPGAQGQLNLIATWLPY
ncbi:hypothetical protein SAMN06295974_3727 [Plantibacter flavus]|uniref:Uncharacterized protein n=1 Tax=Plantibacter flavus TaxID=150123 RepID=A0A3N2BLH5_9MICO|nr:hypothetical protein EDD42_4078 [Plantibacter flavus]SMG48405.1 hypothetical protein SAMN06295974_3727 [Plantibacter flavus]